MAQVKKKATFAIGGCQIYTEQVYREDASFEKVFLLIHGFVSSTYCFRDLSPILAEKYPVIAVDLPGFGQSSKFASFTYSFDNYAFVMLELLKLFGINKAIVVGHSMGGQVALYMALKSPRIVEKVILLSSSGYLKRAKRLFYYASFLPFSANVLKWWFENRDYKNAFSHVCYQKEIDNESLKTYTQPFGEADFFKSLIKLLRDREGDLTSEQIKKVCHETLILWGMEDEIIPVSIGERLHQDLPRSYFKIYPQTGHLLPEEKSQEVAEDILSFV